MNINKYHWQGLNKVNIMNYKNLANDVSFIIKVIDK